MNRHTKFTERLVGSGRKKVVETLLAGGSLMVPALDAAAPPN